MQDNGIKKVEEEQMKEAGEVAVKGGRKKLILIASALFLVAVMVIVGVVLAKESPARRFRKQMDLGAKYLSEQNYEQAIASYQLALEIDPKSVDAYLGLAEVYIATGNYDEALKVLRDGYEKTQDGQLEQKIAEVVALLKTRDGSEGESNPADGEDANNQQGISDENQEVQIVTGPLLVKVTEYEDEGVCGWWEYEYNELGQAVKMTAYHLDGNRDYIYEYEYNKNGQEENVKYISFSSDNEDDILYWTMKYDAQGNKVKETVYNADNSLSEWEIFEYDERGRVTKSFEYDANGVLTSSWEYEYFDNGKEVISSCTWPPNEYYDHERRQWFGEKKDELGNQILFIYYWSENKDIWSWCENEYDEQGNVTSAKAYSYDVAGHFDFNYDKATRYRNNTYVNEYVEFP